MRKRILRILIDADSLDEEIISNERRLEFKGAKSLQRYEIISKDVLGTDDYTEPLPTIPGTAIWANTTDDPQANLDAFILTRYGLWFHANGIKSEKYEYKPEEIASWKPYSELTPQPYD